MDAYKDKNFDKITNKIDEEALKDKINFIEKAGQVIEALDEIFWISREQFEDMSPEGQKDIASKLDESW